MQPSPVRTWPRSKGEYGSCPPPPGHLYWCRTRHDHRAPRHRAARRDLLRGLMADRAKYLGLGTTGQRVRLGALARTLSLLVLAIPAQAATFSVNSLADGAD